jgi:hypothetical protein
MILSWVVAWELGSGCLHISQRVFLDGNISLLQPEPNSQLQYVQAEPRLDDERHHSTSACWQVPLRVEPGVFGGFDLRDYVRRVDKSRALVRELFEVGLGSTGIGIDESASHFKVTTTFLTCVGLFT